MQKLSLKQSCLCSNHEVEEEADDVPSQNESESEEEQSDSVSQLDETQKTPQCLM